LTGRYFTAEEALAANLSDRLAPKYSVLKGARMHAVAVAANPPGFVPATVRTRRRFSDRYAKKVGFQRTPMGPFLIPTGVDFDSSVTPPRHDGRRPTMTRRGRWQTVNVSVGWYYRGFPGGGTSLLRRRASRVASRGGRPVALAGVLSTARRQLARTVPGQHNKDGRRKHWWAPPGGLSLKSKSQPRAPGLRPGLRPGFFGGGTTVRLRPRPIFLASVDRVSA
jgi:hypothetical protein